MSFGGNAQCTHDWESSRIIAVQLLLSLLGERLKWSSPTKHALTDTWHRAAATLCHPPAAFFVQAGCGGTGGLPADELNDLAYLGASDNTVGAWCLNNHSYPSCQRLCEFIDFILSGNQAGTGWR